MADSIREQIISALETKLFKIRVKYAFNTDCGLTVFRGLPVPVSEEFLPASSIMPGSESAENRHGRSFQIMRVRMNAVKIFDEDESPSDISEKILADIIECIQGPLMTVGFDSGGPYIPLPGDSFVSNTMLGGVGATGIIESFTLDSGAWADGDAAGSLILRRFSGEVSNNETLVIDGNDDAATADGDSSNENALDSSTDSLADLIEYVSGGLDSYPEHDERAVGATVEFNIGYKTLVGDPYNQ